MFFTKASLLLSLATGFAAASPVRNSNLLAVRHPEPVPAYPAPETFPPVKKRDFSNLNLGNLGVNINSLGSLGLSLNELNQLNNLQNTQVNIQEVNIQEVSDGVNTAIVQQVQQVIVQDSVNNWFNNRFRRSNFRNNFNDVTMVMLVVQEIQVAVADNIGNVVQQQVFAQSEVIANVGQFVTQTVMVFDSRELIATQVLGGFGNVGQGIGGIGGVGAAPTAAVTDPAAAGAVQSVSLFDAKPTWSSVVDDPAAQATAIAQVNDAAPAGSQDQDIATGGKKE